MVWYYRKDDVRIKKSWRCPQTIAYIKGNFIKLIEVFMRSIDDDYYASSIPDLFAKYDFDFEKYIETPAGNKKVVHLISAVLKSNEEALKQERKNDVKDMEDVGLIYDELDTMKRGLMNNLLPYTQMDYDFGIEVDEDYWNYKIDENIENADRPDNDFDDHDYYRDSAFERMDEDKVIDDLFDPAN